MNLFFNENSRVSKHVTSSICGHKKAMKEHSLITGTLILSSGGLLTRLIGFFHRIYLSQLIGAREMGIYQLIFPVYMIAFSLCCHGIELALSQMIAASFGTGSSQSTSNHRIKKRTNHLIETPSGNPYQMVRSALVISLILSLLFALCIYHYADFISLRLLKEERCILCLKLLAPVLPFTAIRCCLHGYYIGLKKTFVPATGQLIEQFVRVSVIWLIAESYGTHMNFSACLAVCGMVVGEIAGTLYTYINYKIHTIAVSKKQTSTASKPGTLSQDTSSSGSKTHTYHPKMHLPYGKELLIRFLPLTASKLSLTIIAATESILIPFMLTVYYQNRDVALSLYGVLTGMALPFILFPSTFVNSLSVLLLPAVAQEHAAHNTRQLHSIIKKTLILCLVLGFSSLVFFSLFGKQLGFYVFHEQAAGDFLFILSFLSPFLYLSSSGSSILNGFGLMKESFFYNITGLLIRITFILGAIPRMGIQGYLIGLLVSYLTLSGLQWNKIRRSL